MSRTTTIVLVVGIVAILVFVSVNKPRKPVGANTTSTGNWGSLFGLGASALVNAFHDNSVQAPSGNTPCYGCGVQSTDTAAQGAYGLSHGVVEQQGNQLIDLNTGNALVYGP
jgi:hypothetical protein